jgi:hypothetical protein
VTASRVEPGICIPCASLMPKDTEKSGGPPGYTIRIHPFTPIEDEKDLNDDIEHDGSDEAGSDGWRTPASMPFTPSESREDSNGILFTPRRVMMSSFENLVALANHQERLRDARRMVWRDKGQPVVELDTLQQCLTHAVSGAFRELLYFLREWDVFDHRELYRISDNCFCHSSMPECRPSSQSYTSRT